MKHKYDIEDKKELIKSEINRIAEKLGKTPTQQEYQLELDLKITYHQIIYLYGSWTNAVIDAGLNPNPLQQPPTYKIDEEDLIEEFIRVANELQTLPGQHKFRIHSKYSWTPYTKKYNGWQNTVKFFIDNYSHRFNFPIKENGVRNKNSKSSKKLNIDIALINIPTNEMETIVLFALLAEKLGYKIINIQASFPDGLLLKNNNKIKVEFEFLSSNYIQHAHPILSDVMCICWRKDIEIEGLEIFSLEDFLRSKE